VPADVLSAPIENLVRRRRFAIARHNYRMDTLAPLRVAETDDGYFLYLRTNRQRRFHLGRIDVLAYRDDHVALAVDEVDEAILVAAGEVAHCAILSAERLTGFLGSFQ